MARLTGPTLAPADRWSERPPGSAAGLPPRICLTCGADPDALARVGDERDRLAAQLHATHDELTRLRAAQPAVAVEAHRPPPMPATAPVAPFIPTVAVSPHSAVASPDQGIDFGAVARLSPAELDKLPYGLITLDALGRVIHYNDTESRMVGLPKERVIGRNFFTDVAPCTRVREFEGRFHELARDPVRIRVQSFDFVFRFARGEQHVSIVITPARVRGQFHLALLRRAIVG